MRSRSFVTFSHFGCIFTAINFLLSVVLNSVTRISYSIWLLSSRITIAVRWEQSKRFADEHFRWETLWTCNACYESQDNIFIDDREGRLTPNLIQHCCKLIDSMQNIVTLSLRIPSVVDCELNKTKNAIEVATYFSQTVNNIKKKRKAYNVAMFFHINFIEYWYERDTSNSYIIMAHTAVVYSAPSSETLQTHCTWIHTKFIYGVNLKVRGVALSTL